MGYTDVAETLGERYVERPVEFGTEADLRRRLVESTAAALEEGAGRDATVEEPRLVGSSPSYKREYRETIESRLRERGSMDRIRLDVSLGDGRRFDVGVLRSTVDHPIEWVRNGSKRFDERDLEAVFDLKYIKNKCYPPTDCSITDDALLDGDVGSLLAEFNPRENRLSGDLEELRELADHVEATFVLVSNNNYLFAEPTSDAEVEQLKKRRAGEAARQWLADAAGDTNVLYVHPLGWTWLHRAQAARDGIDTVA